jgi:outer membrane receptor for ferrienterochelin and colicins
LGDLDPRNQYSRHGAFKINSLSTNLKLGALCRCENILNWTPNKGNPFIIARANDPFDKKCAI